MNVRNVGVVLSFHQSNSHSLKLQTLVELSEVCSEQRETAGTNTSCITVYWEHVFKVIVSNDALCLKAVSESPWSCSLHTANGNPPGMIFVPLSVSLTCGTPVPFQKTKKQRSELTVDPLRTKFCRLGTWTLVVKKLERKVLSEHFRLLRTDHPVTPVFKNW